MADTPRKRGAPPKSERAAPKKIEPIKPKSEGNPTEVNINPIEEPIDNSSNTGSSFDEAIRSAEVDIPEQTADYTGDHAPSSRAEQEAIGQVLEETENMSSANNDDFESDFNEPVDIESYSEVPKTNWTPLDEPVIKRGYTQGNVHETASIEATTTGGEHIIPEAQYVSTNGNNPPPMDFANDFIKQQMSGMPPPNDIPMDDSKGKKSSATGGGNSGGGSGGSGGSSVGGGNKNSGGSGSSGSSSGGGAKSSSSSTPAQPVSDNLNGMSPAQKRHAVEASADAILIGYRTYVPLPFIYFSSYNIKKIKKLHSDNLIDMNTPVRPDGTTFYDYTQIFNENVEGAFSFTDQDIKDLREPLIEVLMENDIAFTPMQRLLFVVGTQLVQKTMTAFKFIGEKNGDMEMMKAMHAERMEILKNRSVPSEGMSGQNATPPPTQPQASAQQPQAQTAQPQNEPTASSNSEPSTNNPSSGIKDVPFTEEKKEDVVAVEEPTMESIMNDDTTPVDSTDNDIPPKEVTSDIITVQAEEIPPDDY